MKDIVEIRDWLLENAVDEDGNLVLSDLDFSDFEGNVYIDDMKVKYYLSQSRHEVEGNLSQSYQKVKGNFHNVNNEYGGELYEMPSTQLLKEITLEELSELGYKLKGE